MIAFSHICLYSVSLPPLPLQKGSLTASSPTYSCFVPRLPLVFSELLKICTTIQERNQTTLNKWKWLQQAFVFLQMLFPWCITELYMWRVWCVVLCYLVNIFYWTLLDSTIQHCTLLDSTGLYWTLLDSTRLPYTLLYSTVLYCTLLYSTVLYWTLLDSPIH